MTFNGGCREPAVAPAARAVLSQRQFRHVQNSVVFLGIYPVLRLGHYIHGSVWYSLGYKVRLAAGRAVAVTPVGGVMPLGCQHF